MFGVLIRGIINAQRPAVACDNYGPYTTTQAKEIVMRVDCICVTCGKSFQRWRSQIKPGGPYCSTRCHYAAAYTSVDQKIAERTVIPTDPDACYGWTGTFTKSGYAQVSDRKASIRVHKYVYEREHGPLPAGQIVRHHCDNRPCTNLRHLLAGTDTDNMRDRDERGRGARGESSGVARLTDEKVAEARAMWRTGAWPARALARRFGVSGAAMESALKQRTWKHVADDLGHHLESL
jgi:hypothetical protein